jgi:putative transposase
MSFDRRRSFIDAQHPRLSLVRQCELVSISRGSVYYQRKGESGFNLALMRTIDKQYLQTPWYGARQMARHLRRQGYGVGRKRVRRLMRLMNLKAIAPGPQTSRRNPAHKVYPYLLRDRSIRHANEVWCADLTYIPMAHGFVYVVAIMDWHTRHVLSWRLSTTQDTQCCLEALEEAMERYGKPQIFNTDQGSQFTSSAWTSALHEAGIRISMDGKGSWRDNVFIERLWRSMKYECVYLNAFDSIREARDGIGHWMTYYNEERPHSTFGDHTPSEVYAAAMKQAA